MDISFKKGNEKFNYRACAIIINSGKILAMKDDNSPYYYLQQNDVLYVEPNKAKAKNSDIGNSTTLWFSATSIMISLTSLLYNILN